jgi:O-antigen ligase
MFLVLFAPGRGRMWDSGAWAGFYAEKNGLGAAMALSILTLVIVFARARGRQRLLTLVPLALSVALLFGSRSITAVVVWSATVIIVIALSLCRSARFGFAARIASVLLLVIVPVTLLASGIDSNTLFELVGKQSNLTGRTEFWPAVVQAIGDRPILGYGFNAFFSQDGPWVAYMSALTVEWGWIPFHAHNSFYQIALDVGLVGEALFLYVLGSGLFRAATFLMRGSDPMYLWPLAVIVYLTLGSFTETYFASENTIESILFTTALLYPLREPLQKVATYAKAASGRRRSIPVGDPSLAKRQDVRQRPANVTQP